MLLSAKQSKRRFQEAVRFGVYIASHTSRQEVNYLVRFQKIRLGNHVGLGEVFDLVEALLCPCFVSSQSLGFE